MGLHLIGLKSEVPPGGFRYTQRETATQITAPDWGELVAKVKGHRRANGLPVTPNIEEEIENQLCEILPPGICMRDGEGMARGHFPGGLSFEQVKRGTATLVEWFLGGSQKVSRDEATGRARVCAACHYNQHPSGCSACSQGSLRELVQRIVGGETILGEHLLEACLICGCSLKAKIWLPLEVIQKHTSTEMNGQFPEWCWCKKK